MSLLAVLALPAEARADCLVMGDSLAVGVGSLLPCAMDAKKGRTAKQALSRVQAPVVVPTVISLGSNGVTTGKELAEIRAGLRGPVLWVLPPKNETAQALVRGLADAQNDSVLAVPVELLGPDGLHPTGQGYRWLAERVSAWDARHKR